MIHDDTVLDTLAEEAAAIQLGVAIYRTSGDENVRRLACRLLRRSMRTLRSYDVSDEVPPISQEAECEETAKLNYRPN